MRNTAQFQMNNILYLAQMGTLMPQTFPPASQHMFTQPRLFIPSHIQRPRPLHELIHQGNSEMNGEYRNETSISEQLF